MSLGTDILTSGVCAKAQIVDEADRLDELIESIAEELDEEGRLDESATEELAELRSLAANPIDINRASEADLKSLIFLSERKVKAIIHHRQRAGGILTQQEFLTIKGLSAVDILMLSRVTKVGEKVDTSRLAPVVKGEALFRIARRWPLARGYKSTEAKEAAYKGGPYKTLFRLKADVGGRLKFGLVGDNDAGEPQLKNGNGLMDFYGGYMAFEPARGIVRRIIAGHYHVRLGQGLGIWTGFGFDPTLTGSSTARGATGTTPTMSAAESDYMRGVAVYMSKLPFRMTLFASWVDADGTTKLDSDSSIFITTIRTTGYHRTATERKYRHNDLLTTLGGHISSDLGKARIGFGFNNWHTSKPLGYNGQLYRLNRPTGNDISTASIDARIITGRLHLFGEAACQGQDAWGGVCGADFMLRNSNSISFAFRKFGKRYFAQIQQPVSHTSGAGAEGGANIGFQYSPLGRVQITANLDLWKMHWVQANEDEPSQGLRVRATTNVRLTRRANLTFRLRHTDHSGSSPRSTSFKWTLASQPLRALTLNLIAERTRVKPDSGAIERGLLIAQTIKAKTPREGLVFSASCSYFNTDTYDARTYTRRPMVLYDMAFASCSGRGMTATAMLTLHPVRPLKIWLWCTHTRYTGRTVVGSSYEETQGPNRTDVKLQIQWKLWWKKQRDYFGER